VAGLYVPPVFKPPPNRIRPKQSFDFQSTLRCDVLVDQRVRGVSLCPTIVLGLYLRRMIVVLLKPPQTIHFHVSSTLRCATSRIRRVSGVSWSNYLYLDRISRQCSKNQGYIRPRRSFVPVHPRYDWLVPSGALAMLVADPTVSIGSYLPPGVKEGGQHRVLAGR